MTSAAHHTDMVEALAPGLDCGTIVLRLPYRPPLNWPALLRFLASRATPGVEAVVADTYRRTVEVGGAASIVEVAAGPERAMLSARIALPASDGLPGMVEGIRRICDLDADPVAVGRHLRRSPVLAPRVRAAPGLRVPGAWSPFELAVRAVLGQQVTVRGATTLAGRLVHAYGRRLPTANGDGLTHLSPTPATLAEADLAAIGIPRARAATIRALAAAVADGTLVLDVARGLEDAVARLCAVPGIGPWTAHYVAMRGLSEPDAFPAGDLGLRRALARRGRLPSERQLGALSEAWRPWRAYAAMYLWTINPEVSP